MPREEGSEVARATEDLAVVKLRWTKAGDDLAGEISAVVTTWTVNGERPSR